MPVDRSNLQILLRTSIGVRVGMPCFILVLTALRLYIRGPRRWKLDDVFIVMGCFWMLMGMSMTIVIGERLGYVDTTQFSLFTVVYLSGLSLLWSARISILQTISRITTDPRDRKQRQMLCIGFALLWLFEMGQVLWTCIPNPDWDIGIHTPACFCKKQIPLYHLISSIVSDTPLLVMPLLILRTLQTAAPLIRVCLTISFLASACTTLLSVGTSITALIDINAGGGYLILFEGYTGLIVCSLPVLVVAVCHAFGVQNFPNDKSLPPMEYANAPKKDVNPLDVFTSPAHTSSTGSFGTARTSFGIEVISGGGGATSFLGHLRSFTADIGGGEDECEAEIKRIQALKQKQLALEVGNVLQGV